MPITITGATLSGVTFNPTAVTTDPYFMYVPLLLNTTSTNAQQNNTFLDSSTNNFTITRNGTPTQGSFTPYQPSGYWSNYFNGSSYIRSPGFNFSTSDFTIELFLNTASLVAGPQFLGGYDSSGQNYTIAMNAGGVLGYFLSSDGSTWNIASNQTLGTVVANRWHHIVIARSGTKIRGYFDGTGGALITTSAAIYNNATNFWLGAAGAAGGNLTGYLSNVRVLNGSSAYDANQSTITVPTAPFATGTTNQVLLTCQGNRFFDANTATTAKAITVTGTPSVQAFQPFSPAASYSAATYGGSGYFNGSSDYLTIANNAAFDLGTGDFTVEAWVYTNSLASIQTIFSAFPSSGTISGYSFNITTSGYVSIDSWISGVEQYLETNSNPIKTNSWFHVAYTRNSATNRVFVNGNLCTTSTNTLVQALNTGGNSQKVGYQGYTGFLYPFNGYISNLRVVKGTAIYTAAFTPPTLPVTAVSGTSLLTNFTNAGIYDAAWQNNALTVGDAQVSTTQKQWGTTSMKFDGTGDYLSMPSNQGAALGTGDWTIECWVYLSSATTQQIFLDTRATGTDNGYAFYMTAGSKLSLFTSNTAVLTSTSSLSANAWVYIAMTRTSGTVRAYINGTLDATTASYSTAMNCPGSILVGGGVGAVNLVNGYIQDLRITKGVARTITTPTAAFPTL